MCGRRSPPGLADLVDLCLEVVDDFRGDVVAEDLEQVDPLVAWDALVGGQLDALLDLLDGGALGDEVGVLGLPDGLVGEEGPFLVGPLLGPGLRCGETQAHQHH